MITAGVAWICFTADPKSDNVSGHVTPFCANT